MAARRRNGAHARVTRRALLGALGAAACVALAPRRAAAQRGLPPLGVHESVADAMKRLFGARPLKDGGAVMKLDIPLIAENGAVVPVAVEVTSAMTTGNHVKQIYVIADRNRIPVVTRATLTPDAGQAYVGASIRLGETGDVRAIAELSDGTLLQVKREVKVTVGGCGG